jgi:hypothetical protein
VNDCEGKPSKHAYKEVQLTIGKRESMRYRFIMGLIVLLLAVSRLVVAQGTESGMGSTLPSASAASYYYVAKPGELTMQVNIWGDVQKPGRYEVASSTDLVQLISYAGGPTREAKLSEVRISRYVKTGAGLQKQLVLVNLEDFYKTDEGKLPLQPGDAIFVDYVTRFNARDVFTVITTAALVTAAVAQMIYANHR